MTFVKAKLELSKLEKGDQLEILLMKGEPLVNVPKSAVEQGHKILEQTVIKDDIYKVVIEK